MEPNDETPRRADAYVHDLLEDAERRRLERALETDPAWRAAVEAARRRKRLLEATGGPEADEALVRKTLRHVWNRGARRARRGRRIAAVAAAAVIGTLAAVHGYFATLEPSPYELRVHGQRSLQAASAGSVRVRLAHHETGAPVSEVPVNVTLRDPEGSRRAKLAAFRTDRAGTGSPRFELPDWPEGTYELRVHAAAGDGERVVRKVELERAWKLMLSTDKPVYQPSQTIRMRALALSSPGRQPAKGERAVFTVNDPDGNRIFRRERTTSRYGIASAKCALADPIPLGAYRIRCRIGDTSSERTVRVKRYTLPSFSIEARLEQPFYGPGETIRGRVTARYFFGKPVNGARLRVRLRAARPEGRRLGAATARTDADGKARFSLELPSSLPGRGRHEGDARVALELRVTDPAGQRETKRLTRRVTEKPLRLHVIPEAGRLVPGVTNRVYVFARYADGRPAACTVRADALAGALETNELGAARFTVTPERGDTRRMTFRARDGRGRRVERTVALRAGERTDDFLVRPDKAVYQGGDTMRLRAFGGGSQPVFVDLLRAGQTVLTTTVRMNEGSGTRAVDLPPKVSGTMRLVAYRFTGARDAPVRRSRVIHVEAARELELAAEKARETHRPGGTARLELTLRDQSGDPVRGAIGLAAVDEAVYSVLEKRPGLEQRFFTLDRELLEPVYELHGWRPAARATPARGARALRDRALFAATAEAGGRTRRPLDRLVREGYIGRRQLEVLDGPRAAEALENLPLDSYPDDVAATLRAAVRGGDGPHTLEASSYPAKEQRVERLRGRALSGIAWAWMIVGAVVLGLLFFWAARRSLEGNGADARGAEATVALSLWLAYCSLFRAIVDSEAVELVASVLAPPLRGADGAKLLMGLLFAFALPLALSMLTARGVTRALTRWLSPAVVGAVTAAIAVLWVAVGLWLRSLTPHLHARAIYPLALNERELTFAAVGGLAMAVVWLVSSARRDGRRGRVARAAPKVVFALGALAIIAAGLLPSLGAVRRTARQMQTASRLGGIAQALVTEKMDSGENRDRDARAGEAERAARVRDWFPETLYWNPQIVTDASGKASVEVPLADSITTWRVTGGAVGPDGRLGSLEDEIRVFQPFFVELDLPPALTRGDAVAVPAVVYNYGDAERAVKLRLRDAAWYERLGPAERELRLPANGVRSVSFRIRAEAVGAHELEVAARGGGTRDALRRSVRVEPNGAERERVISGALAEPAEIDLNLPDQAVPGSAQAIVRIYPSTFSQVADGLDAIFRRPHGCFEQTSSTTYPNVLALRYLKRTGERFPEVEAKARKYIHLGYQRLLTFEVDGGGFDWFGNPPGKVALTAYGLMEFQAMAKVHDVDPHLLARTRRWLREQRNADGTWSARGRAGPAAGGGGRLETTAYVAWALASGTQRKPARMRPTISALLGHDARRIGDTYTLALVVNALAALDVSPRRLAPYLERLAGMARPAEGVDRAHWPLAAGRRTAFHGAGASGDVETTALACLALMEAKRRPDLVREGLRWLLAQKAAEGGWGTTQAAVLALKALIAGTDRPLGGRRARRIVASLDGERVRELAVPADRAEVMQRLDLADELEPGRQRLTLREPSGTASAYQVTFRYHVPRRAGEDGGRAGGPLSIAMDYGRKRVARDGAIEATARVANRHDAPLPMVIAELPVPPGFAPDLAALRERAGRGSIARVERKPRAVVVYLRRLGAGATLELAYRLEARMPVSVESPAARAYEYYRPEREARSARPTLRVSGLLPNRAD